MILLLLFFFFNDTATTEIYTLSLHDALPISRPSMWLAVRLWNGGARGEILGASRDHRPVGTGRRYWRTGAPSQDLDRKSTRLNSSHGYISYAVFCLKKKKIK